MNSPAPAETVLALSHVSKAFRVRAGGRSGDAVMPALEDISLYAGAGEFVTVIGPSGSGKSTLLNVISGLMAPDSGEILLHGRADTPRLGHIGYMPQRDLLLPWRRLLDNLVLGPEVMGRDVAAARREARELLPLFGLEGFEDAYPATLSGGMRQRAALLRTFLCHQEVILLDEPFGALDALTRERMNCELLEIWQSHRKTMIMVTHDIREAVFMSDRVLIMSPRPGRVEREVAIDLPRPRSLEMVYLPRFSELSRVLRESLR